MSAHRLSSATLMNGAKNTRSALNKTWALSAKTPMFVKKVNKNAAKKVLRTKRVINGHAWKIALSGAALNAREIFKRDAEMLRIPLEKESTRAPWLPSLSKGALMLVEQAIVAYVQDAVKRAADVRDALNDGQRINPAVLKLAFIEVDKKLAGTLAPSAATIFVEADPVKKKKMNEKEGEQEEDDDEPPPNESDEEDDDDDEN